jgi:hypothetical protein
MQHSGQHDVIRVNFLAGRFPKPFDTTRPLADRSELDIRKFSQPVDVFGSL